MALWFKNKSERVLEFNTKKLKNDIHNLSDKLYEYRNDVSLNIIKEVINIAKNIQILEVNMSGTDIELHKGRVQALSDLDVYIENSIAFRKEKNEQRIINQPRRTSSTAGLAI